MRYKKWCACLLLGCLLFGGCAADTEEYVQLENENLPVQSAPQESEAEDAVEEAVTESVESETDIPEESTTESEPEEVVESVPEQTGPVIETIDGCTYADGVLIVNKSYTVPAEYGDGITAETQAAFDAMQAAAAQEGLNLFICSGFRSYNYQNTLYSNYVARDGKAAADTYSARPGHSEHQTGLAVDVNSTDGSMATSPEGLWLAEHCAEYGFVIRYPKGKEEITGYMYEPWHIRYLGQELAVELTQAQLTLEAYFGLTSVYAEE